MNTERLYEVVSAVLNELDDYQVSPTLQQVSNGLRGLTQQAADSNAQNQLSAGREGMRRLEDAPSNGWPLSWRQVLDDMGIADVMGTTLSQRVENVLSQNALTPSVGLNELSPIIGEVTTVESHLTELASAFEYFEKLRSDEPEGESMVSVLMPRGLLDDDAAALGKEFEKLATIFAPFEEAVTGQRSGLVVSSISSSDFMIVLLAASGVGYAIAKGINEVLTIYEKILNIKKSRKDLEESGVPATQLSPIDDYVNSLMAERLDEVAKQFVEEFPVPNDAGRKNELTTDLRNALNSIANRVDKGYELDVRFQNSDSEETSETEDENGLTERTVTLTHLNEVNIRVSRSRPIGGGVLKLPEGNN